MKEFAKLSNIVCTVAPGIMRYWPPPDEPSNIALTIPAEKIIITNRYTDFIILKILKEDSRKLPIPIREIRTLNSANLFVKDNYVTIYICSDLIISFIQDPVFFSLISCSK